MACPEPLRIHIDFDAGMVDEILQRLTVLRAAMLRRRRGTRPISSPRARARAVRAASLRRLTENRRAASRLADRAAAPAAAAAAATAGRAARREAGAPARRRDRARRGSPTSSAAGRRCSPSSSGCVVQYGLPRSVSIANTRSALPPTNASALKPRYPISRSSRIGLGQRVQLPRLVVERRLPEELELALLHGLLRQPRIGPHPAGALRVAGRSSSTRAAAALARAAARRTPTAQASRIDGRRIERRHLSSFASPVPAAFRSTPKQ